jgi:hypothetical protein
MACVTFIKYYIENLNIFEEVTMYWLVYKIGF